MSSLRPIAAASFNKFKQISPKIVCGYNSNHDSWSTNPNFEKDLEIGRDLEHWFVVVDRPLGFQEDKIDSYIQTLATVVGSEEEARMKIYSVSTEHHYAFGALLSEELAYKLRGEPFINGKAVPLRRNSRRREYLHMLINELEDSPCNMRCPHCNMEVDLPGNMGGPSCDMRGFPPERGSTPYIGAVPPNNMRGMHRIISEGCNKITSGQMQNGNMGYMEGPQWNKQEVISNNTGVPGTNKEDQNSYSLDDIAGGISYQTQNRKIN